ncbi:hypothetical protein [Nocardia sp. NPDC051832]|uniref:hypothetical protein n=1 Tax=Nocardia sp. NPDC051832 TaxID=3155673 RepID=UPI0034162E66
MNSPENVLRSLRVAHGYRSQQALADALNAAANEIGLRVQITDRTVRRWESPAPPWPQAEHARTLEALFGRPITELGFTPVRQSGGDVPPLRSGQQETWAARHGGAGTGSLPASVASEFMQATTAYRRMYWSVPAARLERLVAEHAALGWDLMHQIPGASRSLMARAVAEAALTAGRLEFFDLQQPEEAQPSFALALQAAAEAGDHLLGGAALAHMAFAPAFAADAERVDVRSEEARDKMQAARAFVSRGEPSAEMLAWLDAVEAEVETRFDNPGRALELIEHAEQCYAEYDPEKGPSPVWLDWFSPARLAGFKGNTLIAAGRGQAAHETLQHVLAELPAEAIKQRAVVLADLAAAAVLERDPAQACAYLDEALKLLGDHWYATAMDRVKAVRRSLREWDSLPQVRALDGQLYNWHTMIRSIAR